MAVGNCPNANIVWRRQIQLADKDYVPCSLQFGIPKHSSTVNCGLFSRFLSFRRNFVPILDEFPLGKDQSARCPSHDLCMLLNWIAKYEVRGASRGNDFERPNPVTQEMDCSESFTGCFVSPSVPTSLRHPPPLSLLSEMQMAGPLTAVPDPAVEAKPQRRRFTAEYKLRILREVERAKEPGEIGAILRREGLYSSHLVTWRRERDRVARAGLAARRRGPTAATKDPRVQQLERENARLRKRLQQVETLLEIPKKASELLGIPLSPHGNDEPA